MGADGGEGDFNIIKNFYKSSQTGVDDFISNTTQNNLN